jgi:hypothetical protein
VATTIHFWDLETMAIIVEESKRIVTWKDYSMTVRRITCNVIGSAPQETGYISTSQYYKKV